MSIAKFPLQKKKQKLKSYFTRRNVRVVTHEYFPLNVKRKIQQAAGNNNKMESKKKGPNNCNCSSELFYFLFYSNLLLKQAFSLSLRSHKPHTNLTQAQHVLRTIFCGCQTVLSY